MLGTVLAVGLTFALIVALERFRPRELPRRETDPERTYVTPEQLEAALAKVTKDADWLLNEWHEKFSTLHARLSKRAKRAEPELQLTNGHDVGQEEPLPSVLRYRKPWSV